MLVCPECGNGDFESRQHRYIEVMVRFHESGFEDEISEIVLDNENDDELTCSDCGEVFYSPDDLIPESEYEDEYGD